MMVARLLSFLEDRFSAAMLTFHGVTNLHAVYGWPGPCPSSRQIQFPPVPNGTWVLIATKTRPEPPTTAAWIMSEHFTMRLLLLWGGGRLEKSWSLCIRHGKWQQSGPVRMAANPALVKERRLCTWRHLQLSSLWGWRLLQMTWNMFILDG